MLDDSRFKFFVAQTAIRSKACLLTLIKLPNTLVIYNSFRISIIVHLIRHSRQPWSRDHLVIKMVRDANKAVEIGK